MKLVGWQAWCRCWYWLAVLNLASSQAGQKQFDPNSSDLCHPDAFTFDTTDLSSVTSVAALVEQQFREPGPAAWTGNITSCTPGSLDESFIEAMVRRVNGYRSLAGLKSLALGCHLGAATQALALSSRASLVAPTAPSSLTECVTTEAQELFSMENVKVFTILVSGPRNGALGSRVVVVDLGPGTELIDEAMDEAGDAHELVPRRRVVKLYVCTM